MTDDTQILKKSVTAGDIDPYTGGAIIRYIFPGSLWGHQSEDTLPQRLAPYWCLQRDYTLRSTIYHEDFWAGAVGIACTKVSSKSWKVEGDVSLRVRRSQEIMQSVNFHEGWVNCMNQTVMDYLTTDNGWFLEIVRASSALGSQILGLVHLDSLRCQRTGDPEIPVVYKDRDGREHALKSHQVIFGSDLPDPGESWFGVGHCAAERSYKSIIKYAAIETLIYEKAAGRNPSKLSFVNIANDKQIRTLIDSAQEEADQKGILSYMGAVIIPVPGEKIPGVAEVELKGLPVDFDRKQELDITLLDYGNNIGLDPQDLQPLTGQPLGTGAQSQVLDDKAAGKGLQSFFQAFTHAINWWVLPDLTTFVFVEKDFRDRIQEANIAKIELDAQANAVEKLVATPRQAMQYLVDKHIYPKEFIPEDETPSTDLTDIEKAGDEQPGTQETALTAQPTPAPVPAVPVATVATVAKEASDANDLVDAEMSAAKKLFKEITDVSK